MILLRFFTVLAGVVLMYAGARLAGNFIANLSEDWEEMKTTPGRVVAVAAFLLLLLVGGIGLVLMSIQYAP